MDIFGQAGIAAIIIPFLLNIIKKLKFIGNKHAPLAAFILGAILGILAFSSGTTPEGMTLMQSILAGIALGGTSTGLYDFVKKETEK